MGCIPWRRVDAVLWAQRAIWIATTRPDGRPHAVPVWFVWQGGSLYFITQHDMQKAKNLARQPWVVAHTGDGDDAIILQGPSEIVTGLAVVERIDRLYGDKDVEPRTGERDSVRHDGVDLYWLRVVQVMAWTYGSLDTPTHRQAPRPATTDDR
jgi:hypothetical protein